jgi:hypothetical protein
MDDGPVVTLRRTSAYGDAHAAYDVLLDGTRIGSVYQGLVSHDRKPRGSRIVTTRTQSMRWFASPSGGWGWEDTRYGAISIVLSRALDGSPVQHEKLARTAKVTR